MPPKPTKRIAALPASIPFVAPEKTERDSGRPFVARLGANEGNFGCSPLAIEAMARAAHNDVGKYPDPEAFELRAALAGHLGVEMQNIVMGPGIDNLLGLIVRIFAEPGSTILTSLGAYPTFNYHVHGFGCLLDTVSYADDHEDLDGLAARANEIRPAIVYVSNPDNPMGTWWLADAIESFMDELPEDCLLILDEAYGETALPGTLPAIDIKRPNVLRLRTFSKAYGLAGLRCGYVFGHSDLIAPFEKVRDHFGVNLMAQEAAIAALQDKDWLNEALEKNVQARRTLEEIAQSHGLTNIASGTNFVTMDCGRDGAFALDVLNGLMARGIFVRKPMAPMIDRCIRLSCGRPEELQAFDEALGNVLETLR